MSISLLAMLQEFSARRGLPRPAIAVASQDDQILQLVGLLNEVLEDLTTRYVGTALQKTATWASTATENQGLLETLAPSGFKWMIDETFWDRTKQLPVYGPRNPQEWELAKATPMTGPYLEYRIQEGSLLLHGVPEAGHTMAFEYASDWSVKPVTGAYKPFFTLDTDISTFPTAVLMAGLNWKWRLEKGLKYAEQFRTYETQVADFNGHDGSKPTISMNGEPDGYKPGIFIPAGNWPLP